MAFEPGDHVEAIFSTAQRRASVAISALAASRSKAACSARRSRHGPAIACWRRAATAASRRADFPRLALAGDLAEAQPRGVGVEVFGLRREFRLSPSPPRTGQPGKLVRDGLHLRAAQQQPLAERGGSPSKPAAAQHWASAAFGVGVGPRGGGEGFFRLGENFLRGGARARFSRSAARRFCRARAASTAGRAGRSRPQAASSASSFCRRRRDRHGCSRRSGFAALLLQFAGQVAPERDARLRLVETGVGVEPQLRERRREIAAQQRLLFSELRERVLKGADAFGGVGDLRGEVARLDFRRRESSEPFGDALRRSSRRRA